MTLTVALAWLALGCIASLVARSFGTSFQTRLIRMIGIRDDDEIERILRLSTPLALLMLIPLTYANYANWKGDDKQTVGALLVAGVCLTGFLAAYFIACWAMGWRCITMGGLAIVFTLAAPLLGVATYLHFSGNEDVAQILWMIALIATTGAVVLRALSLFVQSLCAYLHQRPVTGNGRPGRQKRRKRRKRRK